MKMVWVKSILNALKWNIMFFLVLGIFFGFGNGGVSIEVFSVLGFVTFFVFFTLENLNL